MFVYKTSTTDIAINIRVGVYSTFCTMNLGYIKIVRRGLGPKIVYVRRHETSCKDWQYTRARVKIIIIIELYR